MSFASLGLRSMAIAMQDQSEFLSFDDFTVMRTPAEPAFWHGNGVIMKGAAQPSEAEARFATAFPDAMHRTFMWDVPDMDPAPVQAALAGFNVSVTDVLQLQGPLADSGVPDGIRIGPVADWGALAALQLQMAAEEGYDLAQHSAFLQGRNAARRAQIAAGCGQWFAAIDGDTVVGSMGIFFDAKIARFQAVETRASHRRRGICSAMLQHSLSWVKERAPQALPVILADEGSAASRLYQRLGFTRAETIVEASKRGY